MKKIITRDKNKGYYRALHLPIRIWVFLLVGVVLFWLGIRGKLPRSGRLSD